MSLYTVIGARHYIKKLIGVSILQSAVFIFYISLAKVSGGTAPILSEQFSVYSNPLPHVLILTAIVVGIATTALGLALIVRIDRAYGTCIDDNISLDHPPGEDQTPRTPRS
ncbi:MAG: cation:proton antiporter subunit C [Proteobacteria bacterium]|nr:cation:proton antiporter subunit C [Pseudomonadota bacterium]